MKHPFQIDIGKNDAMRSHEICLMVGGFKTKQDAEEFASLLAAFMAEGGGDVKRVGFDD